MFHREFNEKVPNLIDPGLHCALLNRSILLTSRLYCRYRNSRLACHRFIHQWWSRTLPPVGTCTPPRRTFLYLTAKLVKFNFANLIIYCFYRLSICLFAFTLSPLTAFFWRHYPCLCQCFRTAQHIETLRISDMPGCTAAYPTCGASPADVSLIPL